jgi:predicted metal-binding membrane protein
MAGGMPLIALLKRQPPVLLAASLAGWIVLLALDRMLILPAICGGSSSAPADVGLTLAVNPSGLLMLAWLTMLAAMMPPLLAAPIAYLRQRSLKRRRFRAIAVFLAGYGAIWFAAAPLMLAIVHAIRLFATATRLSPFVVAISVVLIWQASPAKQHCLNRCHRLPRLSAFGAAADLDCLRYGVTTGFWCVGTCWGLMLLPLTADTMHLPLMAAAAVIIFFERSRLARPARWGFPSPSFPRKKDQSGRPAPMLRWS